MLEGELKVQLGDMHAFYNPGTYFTVIPITEHRMFAEKTDVKYLETSLSHLEHDLNRIEDDYGRSGHGH